MITGYISHKDLLVGSIIHELQCHAYGNYTKVWMIEI